MLFTLFLHSLGCMLAFGMQQPTEPNATWQNIADWCNDAAVTFVIGLIVICGVMNRFGYRDTYWNKSLW